ncbi:MAG: EsaB/YukD family protein [Clostridiales Family XIII bacterium]|jgi:uncharacterized ubiquitin-like protein YukD|nr:EsaB/YukD family protein [Clostridiales Family XIII bacterium]
MATGDNIVLLLQIPAKNIETDIEVPVFISAEELLGGLNTAFDLGVDMGNAAECFLRTENPIALLRGSKTLSEYGIRNGTVLRIESEGRPY